MTATQSKVARHGVTVVLLVVLVLAFVLSHPKRLIVVNGQTLEPDNLFLFGPTNRLRLRPAIRGEPGQQFQMTLTLMKRQPEKTFTDGKWQRSEVGPGVQERFTSNEWEPTELATCQCAVARFPEITIDTENVRSFGLFLWASVDGKVVSHARLHVAFIPGLPEASYHLTGRAARTRLKQLLGPHYSETDIYLALNKAER